MSENKGVRRVGTVTLGIALITIGICTIISVLRPETNMSVLLRLSPSVLIILGAEVLIAAFINNDEKIRYDGVSIFLCAVLIFISLGISVVMTVVEMGIVN